MVKIDKKYFCQNVEDLIQEKLIPEISTDNINEFKIGKNYFYEITDDKLLKVQKWLNHYFQENIELNNAAVAFRKNHSYLHLFEPHKKNYNFLRLDIKSFFYSIDITDVKESFKVYFENSYIDEDKTQSLIDAFLNLSTYTIPETSSNEGFINKKVLPIGFVTSPIISNVIFRKLDIQIQKFCSDRNIIYTRYADDMLFSTPKSMNYIHSDNFINEISIFLSQSNLKLNKSKTLKAKHTISLNGYTIQYSNFNSDNEEVIIHELRISNKKINIIKKLIHMLEIEKKEPKFILKKLFNYKLNPEAFRFPISDTKVIKKYYNDQLVNRLTGYRAYLLSIIVFHNKYQCLQNETTEKNLKIVSKLNSLISKFTNNF